MKQIQLIQEVQRHMLLVFDLQSQDILFEQIQEYLLLMDSFPQLLLVRQR